MPIVWRPRQSHAHARVLLVGYEDQDNLGLRYLSSRLRADGHDVHLVGFRDGSGPILRAAEEFDPHVIGFSLIFQFLAPQYCKVLQALRDAGLRSHFTMGGHYASFEDDAILREITALDSVVRFEGEETLAELAPAIASGGRWQHLAGLSWRTADGTITRNPTRAGIENLDLLPWPDREDIPYEAQEVATASMIAGRGCPWKCSFCSIVTFYEGNQTKGRRRRRPACVVDELEYLHRERGVRVVLWQDDDFLAGGRSARRWAQDIAAQIIGRGLHHDMRWKISCRSDEVSVDALEPLVAAGLRHVYLGVEAGNEQDLAHLNKLMGVDDHLRAGAVFRQLGLSFDFGFMLLNPWSTVESVASNIDFLADFAGDGATPINFCRMLPYAGTPAADRLVKEGRLERINLDADYTFLDPCLDHYYDWVRQTFADRNQPADGTLNLLRLLSFEARMDLDEPVDEFFILQVQSVTEAANRAVLDALRLGLARVCEIPHAAAGDPVLESLTHHVRLHDAMLRNDIAALSRVRRGVAQHLHALR